MKKYERLTQDERNEIVVMLNKEKSIREIAKLLGRDKGTISREIKRNHGRKRYRAHKAQERAESRQQKAHCKFTLKSYALRVEVERLIKNNWSPELVAGRLALTHPQLPKISHEAIYQWIYSSAKHLIGYLLHCPKESKNYKRGRDRKQNRMPIPERVDITQRPQEINDRSQSGHWESDLIVGSGKSALKVAVERKQRLTKIRKVCDKTSQQSNIALVDILSSMPKNCVKSMTYDNGSENVGHLEINKLFEIKSYFCQPYHSWEKGTVENTNGLIRRFFKKGINFDNISETEIATVENWLNNRPRKCLNYFTPQEVFNSTVALAT